MPPRLEMFEEMTVDVRRAFPIYDLWGYSPDSILFVVDDTLHAIGNLSYDPRDIPISRYNRQARRWEPAMRHRDDLLIDEPLRVSPAADGTVVFPGSTYDSILLQQPSCASVPNGTPVPIPGRVRGRSVGITHHRPMTLVRVPIAVLIGLRFPSSAFPPI
jgi:hypothetical protein